MSIKRPPSEQRNRGATLLEIIIAMLVIGMVASGILTAFVFSRRVTHRSGSELQGAAQIQQTADSLRGAIAAPMANGLSLNAGIYHSPGMQNPPAGSNAVAGLALPADFQRFLTDALGDPALPAGINNHGDGRLVIVEIGADLDGDGIWPGMDGDPVTPGVQPALDFNGDNQPDLRRVRVRIQWHTPNAPT